MSSYCVVLFYLTKYGSPDRRNGQVKRSWVGVLKGVQSMVQGKGKLMILTRE